MGFLKPWKFWTFGVFEALEVWDFWGFEALEVLDFWGLERGAMKIDNMAFFHGVGLGILAIRGHGN